MPDWNEVLEEIKTAEKYARHYTQRLSKRTARGNRTKCNYLLLWVVAEGMACQGLR